MDVHILLPGHREAILNFARERLAAREKNPMEREMSSWNARWRGESLDHYLPQGWSFGAFAPAGHLKGFVLAQPILFHRGLTQTLWIECVEAEDQDVARALVDTVSKWARDKHFQCVLLEDFGVELPGARVTNETLIELRTAKF